MGGGKSSSSSNTTTETTTTTAGATGTVGDVLQGQNITVTDNLPDGAIKVFEQIVDLAELAIDKAGIAGEKAIDTVQESLQQAAQPDVEILKGSQKQIMVAFGVAGLIAAVFLFRKK